MKKSKYLFISIFIIVIIFFILISLKTNEIKNIEKFSEEMKEVYQVQDVYFVKELKDYNPEYNIGIYKTNVNNQEFLFLGSPIMKDTNLHFILSSELLFEEEIKDYFKGKFVSKTFVYKNNNIWGENVRDDVSIYEENFFEKIGFKEYNENDRYHLNILLKDDKIYTKEFLQQFVNKIKDKYSYNGVVMFYFTDKDTILNKYEEQFHVNYENPKIFDISRKDFYLIERFKITKDDLLYENVKNEK